MLRWLNIWLFFAVLAVAGAPGASAAPHIEAGYAVSHQQLVIEARDNGGWGGFFWRRRAVQDDRRDEGRGDRASRKTIGAQFWGGPYWGYGARLAHPCEACRSNCKGGGGESYCDRCRARCGW